MRGLADPCLADAVPSVGRWRDSGLPQFPARPQIERLLESCDRSLLVCAARPAPLLRGERSIVPRKRGPVDDV
jgi:hypothetical protein